jgi:hypothetical protein
VGFDPGANPTTSEFTTAQAQQARAFFTEEENILL